MLVRSTLVLSARCSAGLGTSQGVPHEHRQASSDEVGLCHPDRLDSTRLDGAGWCVSWPQTGDLWPGRS